MVSPLGRRDASVGIQLFMCNGTEAPMPRLDDVRPVKEQRFRALTVHFGKLKALRWS